MPEPTDPGRLAGWAGLIIAAATAAKALLDWHAADRKGAADSAAEVFQSSMALLKDCREQRALEAERAAKLIEGLEQRVQDLEEEVESWRRQALGEVRGGQGKPPRG